MQTFYGYYDSPIGLVEIGATSEEVISLFFVEKRRSYAVTNEVCDEAVRQVSEYFDGTRTEFDLPVDLRGTDFQRQVWQQLRSVPFGQRKSRDVSDHLAGGKIGARVPRRQGEGSGSTRRGKPSRDTQLSG